ncbi:MAG: hypothetical protein A2Z12_09315 [Actinobacteria bacterium RBG_16_68_21]|nr:MAG: hypothetical protein A2Z12_09315 [Actinobacteria bacterium RBG_16_68_21]
MRHIKSSIILALVFSVVVPLGQAMAATPTCRGMAATMVGTDGNDRLTGTSRDDVIVAKGGNDVVDGAGGDDTICGGAGDDVISGGNGSDWLSGGDGDDDLDGGPQHDTLKGDAGLDRLRGGTGGDLIRGGDGPDDIVESNRSDRLPEADPEDRFVYQRLTLEPKSGRIGFDLYEYSGPIEVRSASDGLIVVEHVAPETYLLGIDEMPFSWDAAALQAQAIAARTYLANLVAFPRWGLMATYGFDICDTTSCQVYEGAGVIDRTAGDAWRSAVRATAGQILLFEGRPAAALYHAAAGSATRSIQDVWPGSSAVPYLQAVPIDNEGSVYSHWRYVIPRDAFLDILAASGITFEGAVSRVRTEVTPTGGGPYRIKVTTDAGVTALDIEEVRAALNEQGPLLYPALFPAEYAPGKRYPAVAMSPTFTVRTRSSGRVVIEGEGYGHQLGMSQYGAWSMAKAGSSTAEILSHFYRGLTSTADPGFLPDELEVGIGWQWRSVTLVPDGRYKLRGADGLAAKGSGGSFYMLPGGSEVILVP